jgi:hypothetical protein
MKKKNVLRISVLEPVIAFYIFSLSSLAPNLKIRIEVGWTFGLGIYLSKKLFIDKIQLCMLSLPHIKIAISCYTDIPCVIFQ